MPEPRFSVASTGPVPDTLVVGVSECALAGLTAVDCLIEDRNADQRGHVAVEGLAAIPPFESGTPRRPIRLFAGDDLAMPVSELPVQGASAGALASELVRWTTEAGAEEVTMVAGVHDLAVDTAELEAATAEMQRQYAELAKQLAASAEAQPHDRMYM